MLAGLGGLRRPQPSASIRALVLLIAFTALSFASIAWAAVRGDAWDGANRTLLYLTAYALFALMRWSPAEASVLLAAFSLGTAVLGAAVFLGATFGDPSTGFVGGRFSEPAGYANANAALFFAALWPAIVLASRREVPTVVRAVLFASAGVLLQLGLLAQSRGSLFAVPLVLLLLLVLVPGRLRSLLTLATIGATTLAALGPLLDVFAAPGSGLHAALARERNAVVVASAVLFTAGAVFGVLDRRLAGRERPLGRRGRELPLAGAIVGAVGLAALVLVLLGGPLGRSGKGGGQAGANTSALGASRFASGIGTNRFDLWRVALQEFAAHPVGGVGVDNFDVDYARERRSESEEPLYPHSIPIRILSQTGLVGAVLFAGFLICALASIRKTWRRLDPFARAVCGSAVLSCAYWLAHGSVDWFWEIPALAAPAFAWLGLASALEATASGPAVQSRLSPPRRAVFVGAFATAALSLALPGLAATYADRARESWKSDPAAAMKALDRASKLDFLSDRPSLLAGAIASRLGDRAATRQALGRALRRSSANWYAHLELALLDAGEGEQRGALAQLERASALNPRERSLRLASRAIRDGKPLPRSVLVRVDAIRTCLLTGRSIDLALTARCTAEPT
jgi:hypothetical protein